MSKVFSIVNLTSESGDTVEVYIGGMPTEYDDLEKSEEAIEFCLSCWNERIGVDVQSYIYGDGESESADDNDLAYLKDHLDELNKHNLIDWIGESQFNFSLEESYTLNDEDEQENEP